MVSIAARGSSWWATLPTRGPSGRNETAFSFGLSRSEMSQVRTVGRRRYDEGA